MITIELARPVVLSLDATIDMDEKQTLTARKLFANSLMLVKEPHGVRLVSGDVKGALYGCEAVIAYMKSMGLKSDPIYRLDASRILCSADSFSEAEDLLFLLRKVDMRNNRVKRLMELGAPAIIQRNEYRLLWEAVEHLFFNSYMPNPISYGDEGEKHIRTCVMDLAMKEDGV